MIKARSVAVALAAVGLVSATVVVWTSASKESFVQASNTAASSITTEELAAAGAVDLFFGHQSVGRNILDGIASIYADKGVAPPTITEVRVGSDEADGFVHAVIGKNGDPIGKLAAFDSLLRAGQAERTDVALMKLCYVDIRWNTDVDALFASYRTTLDALQRDFPEVTFLHVTTPLTTAPSGVKNRLKVLLGRDDNVARERYNQLLRNAYGERVFDLAAIESTAPDGARGAALYGGYSSDGAHLNETGGAVAALGLLRILADHEKT